MNLSHFFLLVCIVFAASCKEKLAPRPDPEIFGREGDTCRISRVSYAFGRDLQYEYIGNSVSRVTVKTDGFDYPSDLEYDASGKLTKISGAFINTNYEYDEKGRLVKENRVLDNEGFTLIPHYEARLFEYNAENQVIKCSYVEGRGTDFNSFYVKKGEIYKYETYAYDIQGCVEKMETYEREPRSPTFNRTTQNIYTYDKLINPFYGHPGIFDFGMYFGADTGIGVSLFSKHNIVKRVTNNRPETASYVYSATKYPLSGQHVFWQETHADQMTFEYVNCK